MAGMIGIICLAVFFGVCFIILLCRKASNPKAGETWYTVSYRKRHPWDKESEVTKIKVLGIKEHDYETFVRYQYISEKEEIYVQKLDCFKDEYYKCEEEVSK